MMGPSTKACGKMIWLKDWVSLSTQMETGIKVNGRRRRPMDLEFTGIMMVLPMRAIG